MPIYNIEVEVRFAWGQNVGNEPLQSFIVYKGEVVRTCIGKNIVEGLEALEK